jgi:hypothetical protein
MVVLLVMMTPILEVRFEARLFAFDCSTQQAHELSERLGLIPCPVKKDHLPIAIFVRIRIHHVPNIASQVERGRVP